MSLDTIRVFAISKLAWIKQQQTKLREQERETPREYLDRESHYVWGKRYLLTVIESDEPPLHRVEAQPHAPAECARERMSDKRQALVEAWYREQLKEAVPPLLARWQPLMGVRVERFFVQRMKTKWGSCNHKARTIRLNTELAKKPRGVSRIHRRPRDGSPAGADAQRPLRRADGPIHAQVAVPSPGPQSPAGSARDNGAIDVG